MKLTLLTFTEFFGFTYYIDELDQFQTKRDHVQTLVLFWYGVGIFVVPL